jgi:hypothetical protein
MVQVRQIQLSRGEGVLPLDVIHCQILEVPRLATIQHGNVIKSVPLFI